MENKSVGFLILGIAVLIAIIVFIFSNVMTEYINTTCPLVHNQSDECPAKTTIKQQTYLALAIAGIIAIIGIFLMFSKPQERIIVKRVKASTPKKKVDTSDLRPEDKKVFKLVQNNKAIFQAEIIEKTGFGKAKVTRIIDRLEGKGLVERKRRGMTNVVVLKNP